MRTESVGHIRNPSQRHQPIPREGTILRQVYDVLVANAGRPVEIDFLTRSALGGRLSQLRTFYGLDIIVLNRGGGRGSRKKRIPAQFMLIGEWVGKDYVDYLARELEKEKLL